MCRVHYVFLVLIIVVFVLKFTGLEAEAQQELVVNGSFETGDFTGWTLEDLGPDPAWSIYSGSTSPVGFPILPPPVGTFATVTDQGGPDSSLLYQDIQIPSDTPVRCSAIMYYENRAEGFIIGDGLTLNIPNQQYRVDIMDPAAPSYDTGAGVLLNLFRTTPGDPNSLGYTTLAFDLSEFAGTTVRIRAAVVITQAVLNGSIDAVSCVAQVPRPIPTLGELGMISMAGVLGIVGFIVLRRRKLMV